MILQIRRLAIDNLDSNMVQFLRHYKATQQLFINKKTHDEKIIRGYSQKMKVTALSSGFWEDSFNVWWWITLELADATIFKIRTDYTLDLRLTPKR